MPNIIISYRRSDSAAIAGRIRDRLAEYYGTDGVFMDIDSIPFGTDFREQIQEAVAKNNIMLALIGPKWIGAKRAGIYRICEEMDPVRIEVETALHQGIPLIPVLVGGAVMPRSSVLPEGLQKLCFLNAAEVDDGRDFHQHLDRLIRAMDRLLTESRLEGLAQKIEKRPIHDVAAPLPLHDEAAAPADQLVDKPGVQAVTTSKSSAAFNAFFCAQTITSLRVAVFAMLAAWIAGAVADVGHETQVPAMIEHRSFVAIPVGLAVFAASYSGLAQRYWQTFLTVLFILHGAVIFSAAWISYKTETPFDLETWCIAVLLALAIAALIPLRFVNAVAVSIYAAALSYLFLYLANQHLLSTAWMQAVVAVALFVLCAVAHFREQNLWALFQFTESQKSRPPVSH